MDPFSVDATAGRTIHVSIKLNGVPLLVLDTGSSTIVTFDTWRSVRLPMLSLYAPLLRSIAAHARMVFGTVTANLTQGRNNKSLPVIIAVRGGNVLGRDYNRALGLSWLSLRDRQSASAPVISKITVDELLAKHSVVFRKDLGHCLPYKAHMHLKPGGTPAFRKAQPVPFSFREALERYLDRLVEKGMLGLVDQAELGRTGGDHVEAGGRPVCMVVEV
ncbi:uncharacterized protein LOC129594558 [Paramacrobiotus metropolitanus]|uniref:uncharacterized protein LOC129594558 n=1 Tax=Paramacrobiotus metropolitanus TaxID=2943436 RepID=UPI00244617C1|nr:uncharacterized protein LOC129594558 [Paramacrobiotus metropolitanus]